MCNVAKAALLVLSLSGVGCSYFQNRAQDFADCFRLEVSVGVGLQAHVEATDIAHVGLGSSRRYSAGLRYGEFVAERRVENDLPVSYIATLVDPADESLHSLRWGPGNGEAQHRCYGVVAGELNRDIWTKETINYYDVEAFAMAGIVGVQAGFSLGEFFDFVTGIFGADIAGDDGPRRATKAYWHKIPPPIELNPHARP